MNISILVEICEKSISSKFLKMSILVEIFDNSILVEIFENLDFGRNMRKISIFSKFLKMSYFGGNFL